LGEKRRDGCGGRNVKREMANSSRKKRAADRPNGDKRGRNARKSICRRRILRRERELKLSDFSSRTGGKGSANFPNKRTKNN